MTNPLYTIPYYTIYTSSWDVDVDEEDFNGVELIQELVERMNPDTVDAEWLDYACQVEFGIYGEQEHVDLEDYLDEWHKTRGGKE